MQIRTVDKTEKVILDAWPMRSPCCYTRLGRIDRFLENLTNLAGSCLLLRGRATRFDHTDRKNMAEDEGSVHIGGVLLI
ncbi:MAG: hypothetical protein MUO26_03680 [Methanotrichaceae archaeon]|nr:hypothetical protein [Methanotrichaceae archaeon]